MTTRIGFIGLGVMGAPMARNLLAADYEVVAWNRSPEPLAALVEAGARAADTPAAVAAVAAEAEVLITILKDDPSCARCSAVRRRRSPRRPRARWSST